MDPNSQSSMSSLRSCAHLPINILYATLFVQMTDEIHPAMQDTGNMDRGFINPVEDDMASGL